MSNVEAIGLTDLIKTLKRYAKETCEKDESKEYIVVGVIG